jgi:hypothetical protein
MPQLLAIKSNPAENALVRDATTTISNWPTVKPPTAPVRYCCFISYHHSQRQDELGRRMIAFATNPPTQNITIPLRLIPILKCHFGIFEALQGKRAIGHQGTMVGRIIGGGVGVYRVRATLPSPMRPPAQHTPYRWSCPNTSLKYYHHTSFIPTTPLADDMMWENKKARIRQMPNPRFLSFRPHNDFMTSAASSVPVVSVSPALLLP